MLCLTEPSMQEQFEEFYTDATHPDNTNKLFVMIVDECHYGATDRQAHDTYVNDCNHETDKHHGPWQDKTAKKGIAQLLRQKNFLTLLVSATPYCMLSCNSRIPDALYIPRHVTDQQLQSISGEHLVRRLDVFQKCEDGWQLDRRFLPRAATLSPDAVKALMADQVCNLQGSKSFVLQHVEVTSQRVTEHTHCVVLLLKSFSCYNI